MFKSLNSTKCTKYTIKSHFYRAFVLKVVYSGNSDLFHKQIRKWQFSKATQPSYKICNC